MMKKLGIKLSQASIDTNESKETAGSKTSTPSFYKATVQKAYDEIKARDLKISELNSQIAIMKKPEIDPKNIIGIEDVFMNGYQQHPGNVRYHQIMDSNFHQYQQKRDTKSNPSSRGCPGFFDEILATTLSQIRIKGGRFIKKNENGIIEEISNENLIYKKC